MVLGNSGFSLRRKANFSESEMQCILMKVLKCKKRKKEIVILTKTMQVHQSPRNGTARYLF